MKDPAVLFYISDWLTSTAEMDADCRGWYLNLLLHNYDKGSLPNDIEKLANLAGVRFSEFKRFEQVFEQVLKQKFEQVFEQNTECTQSSRLSNPRMNKILQGRETFKDKRSNAGKKSYLSRFLKKHYPNEFKDNGLRNYVLNEIDLSVDLKSKQVLEQVLEHLFELYRNGNRNIDKGIGGAGGKGKTEYVDVFRWYRKNYPLQFEQGFQMKAWQELKKLDRDTQNNFIRWFNAKYNAEPYELEPNKVLARLNMLAMSFLNNERERMKRQEKFEKRL